MTRIVTHTALENRFAVETRSFASERYVVEDGYGGTVFDGYSVIITEDDVPSEPVLIPIGKIRTYDRSVAKMENEMDGWDALPAAEQQYMTDKYNYYKDLRDALKGE